MGSDRRARRRQRAGEFGARHPRLTIIIVCVAVAGVVALCGFQLSYGTYLGRAWMIASSVGMAAAAVLAAAVLVGSRRGRMPGGLLVTWLVPALVSSSAFRFPFPRGRYGQVQAVFNVLHASLLGYEVVTCTAIIAVMIHALWHPHTGVPGRAAPTGRSAGKDRTRPSAQAQVPGHRAGGPAGRVPDRHRHHAGVAVDEPRR